MNDDKKLDLSESQVFINGVVCPSEPLIKLSTYAEACERFNEDIDINEATNGIN